MAEEIITETSQPNAEPQITPEDHAAVDSLMDSIFTPESEGKETPTTEAAKTTTTETPKIDPAAPVQTPEKTVSETPEQAEAKRKAALPAPTPEKPSDKELEAIQPPRNLSPKNMGGWDALRTLAKTRGEENASLRQKVAELEPKVGLPDPKMAERMTSLEQELNRYKVVYQNERSPEFMEKFDAPIQKNDMAILEILKRNGYGIAAGTPEDQRDAAQEAALKKLTGIGLTKVDEKFWDDEVLPKLRRRDRATLQAALDGNYKLLEDRQKELDAIKEKPEEFEKKVADERTQQFTEYTKKMADHITAVTKDVPWCKVQAIPADATPEVKARLEKENEFYRQSEDRFQKMLYPADPVTRVETALAACLSFKLAGDLEQMQTTAKHYRDESVRLQREIDAIKKAGVTSRAGTNVLPGAKNQVNTNDLPDDEAVEAGLRAVGA